MSCFKEVDYFQALDKCHRVSVQEFELHCLPEAYFYYITFCSTLNIIFVNHDAHTHTCEHVSANHTHLDCILKRGGGNKMADLPFQGGKGTLEVRLQQFLGGKVTCPLSLCVVNIG